MAAAILTETSDRFSALFGDARGHGLAAGIRSADDAALREVIWQQNVVAKLCRERVYEYALIALPQLRAGHTSDELWRRRDAPGGVVFSDAMKALRLAGLYPDETSA